MTARARRASGVCVRDFVSAMEAIAPSALAQSWDNVGLLAGDLTAPLRRTVLCIDLTDAVVREAIARRANLVMAYHPPLFKPIRNLRVPSTGTDELVFQCIRAEIAIYSTHTALDAADGGTNDVLASLAGVETAEPIEYVDTPSGSELKLVTFVPVESIEKVSHALFAAGTGHIGNYSHCSFRIPGTGTFWGNESTDPRVGQRGRLETVDELRLECVLRATDLPAVVEALRSAHPYEEPAFDIYALKPKPVRGIGRHGRLVKPCPLTKLAQRLKRATGASTVQLVGPPDRVVSNVVAVAGAAGDLPFRLPLTAEHAIVTGEIRHHDALTMKRLDCCAIALGHWASERPALAPLAERLRKCLPSVDVDLSLADADPFAPG